MRKHLHLALAMACVVNSQPSIAETLRVEHLNQSKVYPGSTLLVDASNPSRQRIVEVDMNGRVLWEHHHPIKARRGFLLEATYLESGNILYSVHGEGIFEIRRDGTLVWKHTDPGASHDVDRLPNGNTLYNRGWAVKGEDVVREVSPSGEVVWSWNGLRSFGNSEFQDVEDEGWMHVNSVTRTSEGDTLISIRNFNTVALVGSDGQVKKRWTFRGSDRRTGSTLGTIRGIRNHEPELLPNGNMLLCLRKPNRFVEFNPVTEQIIWEWSHPDGDSGLGVNREANRLPNGNTLGSSANKIYEVTPSGEIVWELHAPTMSSTSGKVFHKAIRKGLDGSIHGG